ncbi:MAG: hypothetical protein Q8N81_01770 [bacterium]|nr:hypothetical protein [bacterium]
MPRFQVRFEFTKRSDADVGKKIRRAKGICFKLRENETGETDFKQEAGYLAIALKLIFPAETLANLKKLLPDS